MAQERAPFRQPVSLHRLQPFLNTFLQRADAVQLVRPFPDIADHVVEAEPVRLKTSRRRRTGVPVRHAVRLREPALPDIAGEIASIIRLVIAPRKPHIAEPATRRMLPLGLARQPPADPRRIAGRIIPRHMHNRMIGVPGRIRRSRSVDVTPVGPADTPPPFTADNTFCRASACRHIRPEHERPAPAFRLAHMARIFDKGGEFGVGDRCRAHQERLHAYPPDGTLAIICNFSTAGPDIGAAARNLHGMIRHLPSPRNRRRHGHALGPARPLCGIRSGAAALGVPVVLVRHPGDVLFAFICR